MDENKWLDDKIQKQYKEGLNYQAQMQFTSKWPEYERFKAGDQWPPATEKTKNLPRPVFNIIDYIENHKVASVLNENIKMVFSSQEIEKVEEGQEPTNLEIAQSMNGAEMFSKYSETTWENIQQDMINEEVLDSASNIGTGIVHYFWNNSVKGGVTNKYIGDMEGEFLDPINVFFGNPQQKNVQKQPYILISSRDLVSNLKEAAKNSEVPLEYIEQIKSDKDTEDEGYDSAKVELTGTEKATVITKYFKKNGTVWFKKVVGNVMVYPETDTQLRIYPIAIMQWKPRKKSVYGVGDTEGLIPNQKGINFLLAMMLLSAQETAWPKILAKPGALNGQIVTNQPGEIIYDYSNSPNGDGIKYMNTQNGFNTTSLVLVDKFIEITKTFSGTNDAAVGEAPGANIAASAIMMLQKAAGVPIESIRKRFYRYCEDVGRIWEEFWKVKYNLTRMIKVKDQDDKEEMAEFLGTDYINIPFNLKIDIGPAGAYSESLAQSTLDKLFDSQQIDLETYLKYSPKSAMPYKDSLLRDVKQKQQEQAVIQAQMMQEQLGTTLDMQGQPQAPIIKPSVDKVASGQM
ncbi:MAG: hypothetical protein K0S61_685 [Anaerocolumna sp.]|nr:hypothetical protein [Anaerocolumna sp.]